MVIATLALGASTAEASDSWSTPIDLSESGRGAYYPDLTMSSDGTRLTAVWQRFNGTEEIVQTASSTNGGSSWGPTTNLSAAGGSASEVQITGSTDGTKLTAIWRRYIYPNRVIQTASSTDGGITWSDPVDLSAPDPNIARPQITSSADGTKLTAIWRGYIYPNQVIQVASSTNSGTTWTTPANLSPTSQQADGPLITTSADGTKLTAIWALYDGAHWLTQTASSTNGGTSWTSPIILSAPGGHALNQMMSGNTDGSRLTLVWVRSNGTHYIVQTASSTNGGGTWTTPTDLSAVGANGYQPQITSSTDGTKLTAIWQRLEGGRWFAQVTSSTDSGSNWTAPLVVSAPNQDAVWPQITGSADGTKLTAIWRHEGTHKIIQATSSIDGGTTWTVPVDLSAPGQHAYGPQVAGSGDGTKLLAAWYRSNGSHDIVQVASLGGGHHGGVEPPTSDERRSGSASSLFRVSLDANGGTCVVDDASVTAVTRVPFLGYRYIPGADECTKAGHAFAGWANKTDPTTVVKLPRLIVLLDNTWRYFIADDHDLVAVWTAAS